MRLRRFPVVRTRRRRRRGAALVEAVVAIPFFLLVFACLLYVVRLFLVKEFTLSDARSKVWEYALNSCEGNGASQSNDPPPNGPTVKSKYKNATGDAKLETDWGVAKATSRGSVATGTYLGISNKLATTTTLQCDEKPASGNIINVLKTAWHDKTAW
jgi:hypothetical protein